MNRVSGHDACYGLIETVQYFKGRHIDAVTVAAIGAQRLLVQGRAGQGALPAQAGTTSFA